MIESARPDLPPPLADCWTWPVRGFGWTLLVFAALALLLYAGMAAMPLVGDLALLVLGLPMAAAAAATAIEATRASAGGSHKPPDWPDLADFGQLFHQLILGFAAVSMGTFAATILRMTTTLAAPWQPPLYWALLLLGAAYVPACLLGVSLTGTLDGVDPRRAAPAMFRLGRGYLVAWALAAVILSVGIHWPTHANLWLPYLGGPLTGALLLYLTLVLCRLVGRLHGERPESFEL